MRKFAILFENFGDGRGKQDELLRRLKTNGKGGGGGMFFSPAEGRKGV